LANRYIAEYRRIRPDTRASTNLRLAVVFVVSLGPGDLIIDKLDTGTNEDPVFNRNSFPDGYAILHHNIVTNTDALFDKAMIAKVAVPPDHRPLQHVTVSPDARPLPDRY
jgi:hypothetical protein